jgi:tetratricopeptide (TPR) repeat protein
MKRSMKIIISTISCIVIFGCTSIPENNEGFSLDDAIYEAALKISSELPQGERIAVINFDSFEMELSRYIMEEITCRLVIERKLTVIERSGIELLNKELNFQASGYVSDESAQGIGKMVGAESIVIGNIINTGKNYRFYIRVIGIESAVNRCSYIADVSDDQEFMALLAAVKDGSKRADESYKEIQRVRLPITAMEHLDRGRVFIELNEIDLALEFLTKAIQIDQNLDLMYYWRGIVVIKI